MGQRNTLKRGRGDESVGIFSSSLCFNTKMYDFKPKLGKWKLVKRGKPATEKQQNFLVRLGWGKENITIRGAWFLIDAILAS